MMRYQIDPNGTVDHFDTQPKDVLFGDKRFTLTPKTLKSEYVVEIPTPSGMMEFPYDLHHINKDRYVLICYLSKHHPHPDDPWGNEGFKITYSKPSESRR